MTDKAGERVSDAMLANVEGELDTLYGLCRCEPEYLGACGYCRTAGIIERLSSELAQARAQNRVQSDFLSSRQCADHSGKWERGRCLQCELEQARRELAEREGYVLVPREPTPEMVAAGAVARDIGNVRYIYSAMINTALRDTKERGRE